VKKILVISLCLVSVSIEASQGARSLGLGFQSVLSGIAKNAWRRFQQAPVNTALATVGALTIGSFLAARGSKGLRNFILYRQKNKKRLELQEKIKNIDVVSTLSDDFSDSFGCSYKQIAEEHLNSIQIFLNREYFQYGAMSTVAVQITPEQYIALHKNGILLESKYNERAHIPDFQGNRGEYISFRVKNGEDLVTDIQLQRSGLLVPQDEHLSSLVQFYYGNRTSENLRLLEKSRCIGGSFVAKRGCSACARAWQKSRRAN